MAIARSAFQNRLRDIYARADALMPLLSAVELPAALQAWLHRLQLLSGVPFQYLAPDENMLPPESIRFFYLDPNWMTALIDGAFSIGRNLTADSNTPTLALDAAVSPALTGRLRAAAGAGRALALGQAIPPTTLEVVSGFLLRSSLVPAYPGMGVYAYDQDGAPLTILRLERLGDSSDTLICLIEGDAQKIDIHEAPEHLHYGIDDYTYTPADGKVTAQKHVHPFTVTRDGQVVLEPNTISVEIGNCFRPDAPRTLKIAALAAQLAATADPKLPYLNAAQMGFEMTQGVGQVSFTENTTL